MASSSKMSAISAKINLLQKQYDELLITRSRDLAQKILSLNINTIDDDILCGALLEVKERVGTGDSKVEVWRVSGERFLKNTHRSKGHQKTGASQKKHQSSAVESCKRATNHD